MIRLVHRRIAPASVGLQAILPETVRGVIVRRFQHHIDAPAQIAEHRAAVALQRRHHFDHAGLFQHAARLAGPHYMRQVVDAAGRKQQPARGHVEPGGIGDRRHLDGRFGAVEKRIEHLRVHAGGLCLAGGQAVMAPYAGRRHVVIGRQIFGTLAGGDDAKAGGAGPVHHLGGQRRLVAIGQRIDHAGPARFFRKQRPRQHVGLDIDHDDVLAGGNRSAGVADADRGIAGGFHDHLDVAAGCGRAIVGEFRRRYACVIPADGAAGVARALRIEIDDHRHFEPRRMRHLRQEHRAELAGADQGDADGFSGGVARWRAGDGGSWRDSIRME